MKYFALLSFIALSACAIHKSTPPSQGELTYTIPLYEIERAKDEKKLIELLIKDIANSDVKTSIIDYGLRKNIDSLMNKISREN